MEKSPFFDFFQKILSVDLKEVVSVGAISIIGVKRGKNKEKGEKVRIQETGGLNIESVRPCSEPALNIVEGTTSVSRVLLPSQRLGIV